ncbi:MAG: 3-isopropylmalate dehydratase large subunit [Myxococcota bacterium]|nr:3-isopropylmalate dehydratase large subunit [Myxococcota bacterium]
MAGLTIAEKILSRHAEMARATAGDTLWVDVDILMTHDICGPGTIDIFKREFGDTAPVWDRERVVIIPDHYIFTKDASSRDNVNILREFVTAQQLPNFYNPDTDTYRGVCHITLAEEGHTRPGEILLGTDSHTCTAGAFGLFATGIGNTDAAFVMGTGKLWLKVPPTIRVAFDGILPAAVTAKDLVLALAGAIGVDGASYAALEFTGSAVDQMEMPERMTLCNMAIEMGAKTGMVAPDEKTRTFVRSRTDKAFVEAHTDPDAHLLAEHRFEVSKIAPQVAKPHSPDNVVPAKDLAGIAIDRCYIGSCTGGKTEDFVRAAQILKGREVRVQTYCVPATTSVDKDLDTFKIEGQTLRDILVSAGSHVGPPSCAACLGGPSDTFGRLNGGEVCLSTTNRNFPGRMGSPASSVYLASPYTVAASALAGSIQDPSAYLQE